ncbi:hypothetical protein QBC46DRAFT_399060, partial [Diplogelasinospora grovesii]
MHLLPLFLLPCLMGGILSAPGRQDNRGGELSAAQDKITEAGAILIIGALAAAHANFATVHVVEARMLAARAAHSHL